MYTLGRFVASYLHGHSGFSRASSRLSGAARTWVPLLHSRALWVLRNPRFAGAGFFGRTRHRRSDSRTMVEPLPRNEWTALIPNAHPGYITWEDFEENQRRLRENAAAHGDDRRQSPPREGPALLQGR